MQENVDLVRQRFEALNRGNLATMVELTDPAAVWWDRRDDPVGGAPHRGREACLQHLAEILEDIELQAHPQEFIDAGNSVVVAVRLVGRGRTSGVAFEEQEFHVFTLRDGKVIETREYHERDEALKAVGLREKTMSRENVERLHWLYREWAKGNMWALRDVADPAIEWEWSEGLANLYGGPRIYRGLEVIEAATREWLAAWDFYWMTAEGFIQVGDQVVALTTTHARAADTSIVLEQPTAAVWALRDGKAVRVPYYEDRSEALQAVGLRE